MKLRLLFLICLLSSSFVFSQIVVVDDFEDGTAGRFNLQTTYSGSTRGILGTTPIVDTTGGAMGTSKSLRIELIDNPADTLGWFVRFLSGMGSPANNQLLGATGHVGYWIKTNKSYLKCGIIIDDLNASGTGVGTNEISDSLAIIGDGQWNVYQWDLADSNRWYPFIASGNGMIQDPVSIDAVIFIAPHPESDNDTAVVYFDRVSWNPTGYVPVEFSTFSYALFGNQVDLRWVTASELNNKGFEVERKYENSSFERIAFVEGKGTTTQVNGYTYSDIVSKAGKYAYRLKQVDFDGTYKYSQEVEVDVIGIPGQYALSQNYPNPFNPTTGINYFIPESGFVTLSVYNLLGQKVADLVNEFQVAGEYSINFDGKGLASGTYIYSLNANGNVVSKKMTLLK